MIYSVVVLGKAEIHAAILWLGIDDAQHIVGLLHIGGHLSTHLGPFDAGVGRATRLASDAQIGALIDNVTLLEAHNDGHNAVEHNEEQISACCSDAHLISSQSEGEPYPP